MAERVADSEVTFDDCWAALSRVERRRCLFDLLEDPERPIDPDWCDAPSGTDPRAPLRHVHLAKLEGLDIVEVDADAGVVRRGPDFAHVKPMLEVFRERRAELPDDLV